MAEQLALRNVEGRFHTRRALLAAFRTRATLLPLRARAALLAGWTRFAAARARLPLRAWLALPRAGVGRLWCAGGGVLRAGGRAGRAFGLVASF
ncbi:hypothetical protein RugamoR57_60230 [Duganella caerulea]